jgi:hypothetical protein
MKCSITASAILLLGAASASAGPSYEVAGLTITPHQVGVLGTVLRAGNVQERAPETGLTLSGMPASPHSVAVLTPRPKAIDVAKK